jgi:DNA-binding NarL/FixJ family response regulator
LRGLLDAVVTDVRFGADEMSGVDLLRAVRASGSPIPIVLYSAWDWTPEERAE